MRRIKVVFLFNYGRIERLNNQECPDEFFYGARNLSKDIFAPQVLGPHPPSQGLISDDGDVFPLPSFLRDYYLKNTRITFLKRFFECLFALKALNRADVIVAINAKWVVGLNLLAKMKLLKPPMVGIVFGPFLPRVSLRKLPRVFLRKRILWSGVQLIFTGAADHDTFLKYIVNSPSDCHLMFFGVDAAFWHPGPEREASDFVLSIGSAGRDYRTLFDVWKKQKDVLKVITSLLSPTEPYPENIQVHYGNWAQAQFSDGDIHSLFQRCKYVITPLVESTRPNGQSATLQAMSCGKAVILTRTEGLWDRENMKHLENCYLVSPRDSQELGSAISYFESNPDEVERIGRNARETVLKFYTTARFAKRLESIVLSLTA